jgi:hypothetical protein
MSGKLKTLKFTKDQGMQLLQKGINQIETVTLDYKAIHQFSILYLQRRQKRSGKLKRFEILLSSKGIIFAKMNQSIQNTNWNSNS